jgi:hypothetical protein
MGGFSRIHRIIRWRMDPGRREAREVIMDNRKAAMTLLTAFALLLAPLAIYAGNGAMQDTLAQNQKLRVSEELRSTNGQYTLALQGDGNLVASDSQGRSVWSSNTAGSGAVECVLQGDGNLLLKDRNGKVVWATNTDGFSNARLIMQDDGLLVLYSESEKTIWANGNLSPNIQRDTSPSGAQGVDKDSLSSYNANTGDDEFDRSLNNLNTVAYRDLNNFINQMSGTFDVSKPWVEGLVKRESIPPADVYMIARTASVTNRPIDTVARQYKDNRGQGWGVIAQRLGIKPGSKEFHALKNDDAGFLSRGKRQDRKKNDKGKK